jgi:uncharacterized repeat protein (TIGR01451 family)
MSDRASGHRSRSRLAGRAALLLTTLGLVIGPVAPLAVAAGGLDVTTPFPSIVAEPGNTASFKLTISVPTAGDVALKATGVPDGWTARFNGGGLVVDSAYVTPSKPVEVTLDLEVPAEQAAATTQVKVEATGPGGSVTLPLSLRVADAATGDVTMTTDAPAQSGPSTTTFTFNLSLKNSTPAEATYSFNAQGPAGWTVSAKPASQAQATSIVVGAGSSTSITVSAEPPTDVDAGDFPILVTATGGGKTAQAQLQVTITGTYTLAVSTPNQVLSTTANAGSQTDFTLTLTNNGTAPITQVTPTAQAPTNWKVTFDPPTIASIAPGQPQTVIAHIIPTGDAITGDYALTMTARGAEASGDVSIRVTVQTPAFWWIAGVVLLLAVLAGLGWVFRTYGRR